MPNLPFKQYAQALFDLSRGRNTSEAIHADLLAIKELWEKDEGFKRFILNPIIPSQKRITILKGMFEGKAHQETLQFLLFLVKRVRLDLLNLIIDHFHVLFQQYKNILNATVISRFELSIDEKRDILAHLKNKFRKDIEATWRLDPRLIGGIKLQIDGTIYDYSLKTQLERFRRNLINA